MEDALTAGELESTLNMLDSAGRLAPQLRGAYAPLIPGADDLLYAVAPFRAATVETLLQKAEQELASPSALFDADVRVVEMRDEARKTRDSRVESIAAHGPQGMVELRMSTIPDLRYWRIGFNVRNPVAATLIDHSIAAAATTKLASGLSAIRKIAKWLRQNGLVLEAKTVISLGGRGQDFEQLTLDILNEREDVARHASLFEDFAEKTDLRISLREPYRRRGVRAQVTMLSDRAHFAMKRASMLHGGDELVLISPVTLADALLSEQLTTTAQRNSVLTALHTTDGSGAGLVARKIGQVCADAMAQPQLDPRGPLANVPSALRDLVRDFVAREAVATTSRLRSREKREQPQS